MLLLEPIFVFFFRISKGHSTKSILWSERPGSRSLPQRRGKFVTIMLIAVAAVFVILVGSEKQQSRPNDFIVLCSKSVVLLYLKLGRNQLHSINKTQASKHFKKYKKSLKLHYTKYFGKCWVFKLHIRYLFKLDTNNIAKEIHVRNKIMALMGSVLLCSFIQIYKSCFDSTWQS